MTIQEAYNKGLDDAENLAYLKLKKALSKVEDTPFGNPKMEQLRQEIINFVNSSSVEEESGDVYVPTDYSIVDIIEAIILEKRYEPIPLQNRKYKVVKVFEQLMTTFINLSRQKTNVGKSFSKVLKDFRNELTSDENVVQ